MPELFEHSGFANYDAQDDAQDDDDLRETPEGRAAAAKLLADVRRDAEDIAHRNGYANHEQRKAAIEAQPVDPWEGMFGPILGKHEQATPEQLRAARTALAAAKAKAGVR